MRIYVFDLFIYLFLFLCCTYRWGFVFKLIMAQGLEAMVHTEHTLSWIGTSIIMSKYKWCDHSVHNVMVQSCRRCGSSGGFCQGCFHAKVVKQRWNHPVQVFNRHQHTSVKIELGNHILPAQSKFPQSSDHSYKIKEVATNQSVGL